MLLSSKPAAAFEDSSCHSLAWLIPRHTVFDLYQVESEILSMGQRPGLYVIDREGVVKYAQVGWQQWEIPGNAEVLEICRKLTLA